MTAPQPWLRDERSSVARNTILDVAETLYSRHGVADVTMRQIADAAGCSRATLYRYFPGRTDLDRAYIDRETRTIAAALEARTAEITDPADRLTTAVLDAVAAVRGNPALMQWFSPTSAATTGRLAMSSHVIDTVTTRFVRLIGTSADATDAQWIVRIIISLLTLPATATGAADEEALVRRYVTPVIIVGPGHQQ